MNHAEARPIVYSALETTLGRIPSLREVYIGQAVCSFDGNYGKWSSPPAGPEAPTCNNWGGVQYRPAFKQYVKVLGILNPDRNCMELQKYRSQPAPASPDPTHWFYALDYLVKSGWFYGPYAVYATPELGCSHVMRILKYMGVFKGTTWTDVASIMYKGKYFGGYTSVASEAIKVYATNLEDKGRKIAKELGETCPLQMGGSSDSTGLFIGSVLGLGLYYWMRK